MAEEPIQGSLADSIAMLEQILEVMPQDVEAIKALYSAYAQGGLSERAFEYLGRLVDVVMGGGNDEALAYVRRELPRFEDEYPSEVAAQIARLRSLAGPGESVGASGSSFGGAGGLKSEVDISEELALAWRLFEDNQLTQEEYSSVLHDLTEVSSKEIDVPVSVLHVLADRGFANINRIMNHISSRSGVPFARLENFEQNEQTAKALPISCAAHDGALPFGFIGNDLMVGVLNPFNRVLVNRIESESGHRCHTYLVESMDYDAALERLKEFAEQA